MDVHDARKERLDDKAVWDMVKELDTVVIAKGKTFLALDPGDENKELILKEAIGRSGSLRAPSIRIGNRLIVGYNAAMYGDVLAAS